MTVITYQCDKCQRQINLVQQPTGIDHIGHCNITLGCRGNLYQIDVHQDYIRGQLPPDVKGLQNWEQRKVLYNYTQTVARSVWNITHDLGTIPVIEVYVLVPTPTNPNNLQQIIPDEVVFPDQNTATLTFSRAYSGQAQLIARASNPDLLHPRPVIQISTPTNIQLTNSGELTIATKIATIGTPTSVTITLQYTDQNGNITLLGFTASNNDGIVQLVASNVPNSLSPWSDVNTVLIKSKGYTVRTLNIQTIETINGTVPNGATIQLVGINSTGPINIAMTGLSVPNNYFQVANDYSLYFLAGSPFNVIGTVENDSTWNVLNSIYDIVTNTTTIYVTGTIVSSSLGTIVHPGTRQINPDEILILLGNIPFTPFDKITNQYIDFTAVDDATAQFNMYISNNEFFASTTLITTIYPPIRQLT